jgi:hypothetical protein
MNYSLEEYKYLKPKFEAIREYCPQAHRLYTTVADGIDNFMKRHEPRLNNAENNPMYEGKATVAQAFDSLTATRYYQTFRPAMMARLGWEDSEHSGGVRWLCRGPGKRDYLRDGF